MADMEWLEKASKAIVEQVSCDCAVCEASKAAGRKLVAAVRLATEELQKCHIFPSDTMPTMPGKGRSTAWWYNHIQSLQSIQGSRVARTLARLRSGDVEDK